MRLITPLLSLWWALSSRWSRVWLAVRFRRALNYSWRLAWYMARRPS